MHEKVCFNWHEFRLLTEHPRVHNLPKTCPALCYNVYIINIDILEKTCRQCLHLFGINIWTAAASDIVFIRLNRSNSPACIYPWAGRLSFGCCCKESLWDTWWFPELFLCDLLHDLHGHFSLLQTEKNISNKILLSEKSCKVCKCFNKQKLFAVTMSQVFPVHP